MSSKLMVIEANEHVLLRWWADQLRPAWRYDPFEELVSAEWRIGLQVYERVRPVALASITPYGDRYGKDIGALWWDHFLVQAFDRGHGRLQELYWHLLEYSLKHPQRRILSEPLILQVKDFFERRGWVKYRDAPDTSFGIYELRVPTLRDRFGSASV